METICPVCTEKFRDPRILHCGHHFCLPCLDKIAGGHPDGHVICPTCRHLTDITDVSKLHRYRISVFQSNALDFMLNNQPKIDKPCIYCQTRIPATMSCLDCSISFCEICTKTHQTAIEVFKHRVVPISSNLFCKSHPDWFIQCICETCDVGCCHLCSNGHKEHKLSDLRTAAMEAREALNQEAINLTNQQDEDVYQRITKLAKEYREMRESFKDSIRDIREHLQTLLETVDQIETEFEHSLEIDIKQVEILEFGAKDFMRTKAKLQEYIIQLSNNTSDVDVIFKQKEFPVNDKSTLCESIRVQVDSESINYADLNIMNTFKEKVLSCTLRPDDVAFKSYSLSRINICYSLGNLELCSKIKFPVETAKSDHMYYWHEQDTFITYFGVDLLFVDARTGSNVKMVDIGADAWASDLASIAFDTKRECVIIPTRRGSIATMELDGRNRQKIKVTRYVLHGAAYSKNKDLYVVCSAGGGYEGEDLVYIVDPGKKEILQSFKPNVENAGAMFVACGFDSGLSKDEVIYLSCHLKDLIEVHDLKGNLLYTYFDGDSESLSGPIGLYIGKELNLVCNFGAEEIFRFWRDKYGNHKETIISKDMLNGLAPSSVYWNEDKRELYVCCDSQWIYIFRERTKMFS